MYGSPLCSEAHSQTSAGQSKLGGGEGVDGLYGSIKRLGMHKVLQALVKHCSLNCKAHLVDVGAGLGR